MTGHIRTRPWGKEHIRECPEVLRVIISLSGVREPNCDPDNNQSTMKNTLCENLLRACSDLYAEIQPRQQAI